MASSPITAWVVREVEAFSGECYLTSKRHRTGSDRVAETARGVGGNIIVNVQADNFGLSGAVLDRAIARFKRDRTAEIATLARRINDDDDLFNPDIVKLLTDKNNWALIFSRFPVPYVRDIKETGRCRQYRFLEHIGVYFFRRPALARFAQWNRTDAEKAESLEQLRILENGGRIRVYQTKGRSVAIDSPRDVNRLKQLYD